jgi:hypothetical protein
VTSKKVWRFGHTFVAFSEYLNFKQETFHCKNLGELNYQNILKALVFKITKLFFTPYAVKYEVCNAVVRQMETIPRTR